MFFFLKSKDRVFAFEKKKTYFCYHLYFSKIWFRWRPNQCHWKFVKKINCNFSFFAHRTKISEVFGKYRARCRIFNPILIWNLKCILFEIFTSHFKLTLTLLQITPTKLENNYIKLYTYVHKYHRNLESLEIHMFRRTFGQRLWKLKKVSFSKTA